MRGFARRRSAAPAHEKRRWWGVEGARRRGEGAGVQGAVSRAWSIPKPTGAAAPKVGPSCMLLRREQRLQLIVRGERCRRWRNGRSHHHPLLEVALAPSGQWATHRVLEADASDAITGCCLCDARVHEGQLPGIIGEQAAQHLLGLEVLLRTIGGVADMPPSASAPSSASGSMRAVIIPRKSCPPKSLRTIRPMAGASGSPAAGARTAPGTL